MTSIKNYGGYNCGGFALRTFDWFDFSFFDEIDDDEQLLNQCVDEIKKRVKGIKVIKSYKDIPEEIPVIGFRISGGGKYYRDFHFILRKNKVWWHKPASWEPRIVDFDIEKPWPRITAPYDSEIIWFIKKENLA